LVHDPQWVASFCRSKQLLPHNVKPLWLQAHDPNEHVVPDGQTRSQAPQCWLFV
jgi:hypothetical protein